MPKGDGTGPLGRGPRGSGRGGGCRRNMVFNTGLDRSKRSSSGVSNISTTAKQEPLEAQAARLEEQAAALRNSAKQNRAEKRCSAGTDGSPKVYSITDTCRGCDACRKACPVDAISGNRKEQHYIDPLKCVKCGTCMDICPFNAIRRK
ncbi:MAG: 4Fe-4S binding protein [Veillonellales bacterium]